MEKEFKPLLFENLDIKINGYRLLRIALNRHMRQVERVSPHSHSFHQWLVYLKGAGTQIIERQTSIHVERGDVIFLHSKLKHEFRKKKTLPPLCLAINFTKKSAQGINQQSRLNPIALGRLEHGLIRLGQLNDTNANSLIKGSIMLEILGILEETASDQEQSFVTRPLESRIMQRLNEISPMDWNPKNVATPFNCGQAHLNSLLQKEGSRPLGRIISEHRLQLAQKHLLDQLSIGQVGEKIGMLDQNYFARWFRKESGYSPSAYRLSQKK